MGAYEVTHPCRADTNSDGRVNVNDLLAVINAWGPCPVAGPCSADVAPGNCNGIGDGVVNVNDLLAVINGWGCCPGYVCVDPPVGPIPQEVTDCMQICMETADWGKCMDKCLCAIGYYEECRLP
jgi:hypothetical protein